MNDVVVVAWGFGDFLVWVLAIVVVVQLALRCCRPGRRVQYEAGCREKSE